MGSEDERAAATIYSSLSSYVITASLAVIAAQAVLATFVLDKRDHLTWFYIWMVVGLLASVLSIVRGGRGIGKLASAGFKGAWNLKLDDDYFNQQAVLCLFGMACLLLSLFCGTTKPDSPKAADPVPELMIKVDKIQSDVSSLQAKYAALLEQLQSQQPKPKQSAKRPRGFTRKCAR